MMSIKHTYLALSLLLGLSVLGTTTTTSAVSGADWKAGRIIDDGIYTDKNSMSAAQIQEFLNRKVGTGGYGRVAGQCDTNGVATSEYGGGTRAQYGASRGNPAPFTCLKDFYEVPKTSPSPGIPANNYGGAPIPAGAKSAAQLIWDAAQAYNISPKVLLVTIQKESAGPLTTDDWPLKTQYTYAMGAHCPDSGPGGSANCDSNYAGFSIQIAESARLMRYYLDNMGQSWWPYKKPGNNAVRFHPNEACGSSNVFIESKATAALYTYTPYQPNATALSNIYGGQNDGCSSYGNRNFWRIFSDWFGSTQTSIPFAWSVGTQESYSNSSRTLAYTSSITSQPGGKIYMRVKARNVGIETWSNSSIRIGTSNPKDRLSVFHDSTWLSPTRATVLKETTVYPGETGTFEFVLSAPSQTGTYYEYFNLVADGKSWFQDIGFYYDINVVAPIQPNASINPKMHSGAEIKPGEHVMSPDTQSILALQPDGNLVLYTDFSTGVWASHTSGSVSKLIMQTDGNLVLYSTTGAILWQTHTYGNPGAYLALQTDGNMVLYSQANTPLWAVNKTHNPDHLSYVNTTLYGLSMRSNQSLETANRKYKLVQQVDGNVVLYNSAGRALWQTATAGSGRTSLALQPDGNVVLYNPAGRALWQTSTYMRGFSRLTVQPDGNLVLYDAGGRPTWHSGTAGLQ